MATTASVQNIVTENANVPGGTSNPLSSPRIAETIAHSVHAIPIPKKTLTALLPVTLPMLESAYLSCMAATLLAKVSANQCTSHKRKIQS